MKLTEFTIFFILIYSGPLIFAEYNYSYSKETMKLNHKYETNMTAAVQDSVNVLRENILPELQNSYESYKINPINPQPAYDAFIKTLAINFGVEDNISKNYLSRYVPVFAVVDYDGLLLNVYKEYTDTRGDKVLDRVWLPKIAFAYEDDEKNIINFTIDENVEVYDVQLGEWYEGTRSELLEDSEITIDLLSDAELFDSVRRTTIVNTLQEQLAYYINEHNVYTKQLDITYKFIMPLIDNEDWYNTVDDVSIMAFFQGYPSKMSNYSYNKYAFVGARINYVDRTYAGVVDGVKRYWAESCGFTYQVDEIYSNKRDAASKGYYELSCLNPNK